MATILDGKALSAKCKEAVKAEAQSLARKPGLAVIIVGNNPASRVYVNSKRKDCEECGFLSEEYALPEETTQAGTQRSGRYRRHPLSAPSASGD